MTVIKRKQGFYANPNSSNNSDTESLHLGSVPTSDTESVSNESDARVFAPIVRKTAQMEDAQHSMQKWSGRRRIRRYLNRTFLQTLSEEEESETVMETIKTPFARLLEDEDAFEFWNKFVEKNEVEQMELLENQGKDQKETEIKKEKFKISSKIKRFLKIKKDFNVEQLQKLEEDLVIFFKDTPKNIYAKFLATYFERLLMHNIAKYHHLKSLVKVEDGERKIEVYNDKPDWLPCQVFLCEYLTKYLN